MSNHNEEDFWGQHQTSSPKEKKKYSWLGITLVMIIVFAVFGMMGFKMADTWLQGGITPEAGAETTEEEVDVPPNNRLNILLLGIDQRANEPARADTIIVAFLDLDENDVKLLSIPRDTYVKIPGYSKEKIGHANAYGGPELTVRTVENLLGINIDKYVAVNFEGFQRLIDALGGIEMEIEKRMVYPPENIDLKPGKQRLNGHDALAYVRYRGDTGADISRIARQQKFLKELAEEVMQVNTILKLPALVREANECVETDISVTEMLSLAKAAKNLDTSAIEAATLPGKPQYIDNISYWIPDTTGMEEMISLYSGSGYSDHSEPATVTN
ncbi:MAG: LCP family protein [Bacillota bacterium]|jgi:LCP family protein required for cell wall assembly